MIELFKRKLEFYGGGSMADSFPAYVISEQTGLRYKVRVVRSSPTTHVGTGFRVNLPELTSILLDDGRRLTIHGDNRFVAINGESSAPCARRGSLHQGHAMNQDVKCPKCGQLVLTTKTNLVGGFVMHQGSRDSDGQREGKLIYSCSCGHEILMRADVPHR